MPLRLNSSNSPVGQVAHDLKLTSQQEFAIWQPACPTVRVVESVHEFYGGVVFPSKTLETRVETHHSS